VSSSRGSRGFSPVFGYRWCGLDTLSNHDRTLSNHVRSRSGSCALKAPDSLTSCRNRDPRQHRDRTHRSELKAPDPLASCRNRDRRQHRDRTHRSELKALDPLAVAARDILALRTTRENSARADDYTSASAPRPFSPPGTAPHSTAPHSTATADGLTPPQPPRVSSLACSLLGARPSHGFVATRRSRRRAPTARGRSVGPSHPEPASGFWGRTR